MNDHRKDPRRQKGVDRTHDEGEPPLLGLNIEPPPKETGPEPLYRVAYVIDIGARNPREAAERAREIMTDPTSMPPVLDVLDFQGRRTRVDLSGE